METAVARPFLCVLTRDADQVCVSERVSLLVPSSTDNPLHCRTHPMFIQFWTIVFVREQVPTVDMQIDLFIYESLPD